MRAFLVVLIAVASAAGASYYFGYFPFNPPMLSACEAAVKN